MFCSVLHYTNLSAQHRQSIVFYIADPETEDVRFYWRDSSNNIIGDLVNLVDMLKLKTGRDISMAMNGGMYNKDQSPQGLYIENGRVLSPIDTAISGYGNFYMQPNGIFYITKDKRARVSTSKDFVLSNKVLYATQSGPMLVINGEMNDHFIKGSKNLNIRNGVGILSDGKILFAISKQEINFYDFADFFMQMGCASALYLDGYVSGMYLPSKNYIYPGKKFGVMIAVTPK